MYATMGRALVGLAASGQFRSPRMTSKSSQCTTLTRGTTTPKVTPPEGVLMRIEGQYAKRPELEYYGALMYLEGAWHFADTVEIADNVIVERFRPWNDEEAAK